MFKHDSAFFDPEVTTHTRTSFLLADENDQNQPDLVELIPNTVENPIQVDEEILQTYEEEKEEKITDSEEYKTETIYSGDD